VQLAGISVGANLLTFQVGADDGQVITVAVVNLTGSSGLLSNIDALATATAGSTISLGNATGASGVLSLVSAAIDQVASLAADFGAVQNRLTYTLDNLSSYSENLTSAQATIVDVDMASEETEFTKDQILEQAGISMLSQAEQNPQAVLKLLGA